MLFFVVCVHCVCVPAIASPQRCSDEKLLLHVLVSEVPGLCLLLGDAAVEMYKNVHSHPPSPAEGDMAIEHDR